jgi:hypothetical protein
LFLFCDVIVVMIEPLVDLKPNIDELDIVETEVLVLDSAKYFFTCKKCNVRHNLINCGFVVKKQRYGSL